MDATNNRFVRIINRVEDGLLVLMLSAMVLLAVFQIISRNVFSDGVVWIDPLLRVLVLWVGLTGAIVAARTNNHIRIDVFVRFFPDKLLPVIQWLVYLFTICVCSLIAWHAARFVYSEFEYGTIAFGSVPSWLTAAIIPVSFLLIAVRYLLLIFTPVQTEKHTDIEG